MIYLQKLNYEATSIFDLLPYRMYAGPISTFVSHSKADPFFKRCFTDLSNGSTRGILQTEVSTRNAALELFILVGIEIILNIVDMTSYGDRMT
jgi:hypothetical protein